MMTIKTPFPSILILDTILDSIRSYTGLIGLDICNQLSQVSTRFSFCRIQVGIVPENELLIYGFIGSDVFYL
jgi:hypothetical protein